MMSSAQPTPPTSIPPATANSSLGTLGVAASQAASLGLNPASAAWWNIASQLAAQDYLTRVQQGAQENSSQQSTLQGQNKLQNLDLLAQTAKIKPKPEAPPPVSTSSQQKAPGHSAIF